MEWKQQSISLVNKTKIAYLIGCVVMLIESSSISDSTRLYLNLVSTYQAQIKLVKPNSNTL